LILGVVAFFIILGLLIAAPLTITRNFHPTSAKMDFKTGYRFKYFKEIIPFFHSLPYRLWGPRFYHCIESGPECMVLLGGLPRLQIHEG